jgi:hypothetical protein
MESWWTVSGTLDQDTDEIESLQLEMKGHGGEFVARDSDGRALAYGASEDDLVPQLADQGLQLWDVLVSRVPKWDCGFII